MGTRWRTVLAVTALAVLTGCDAAAQPPVTSGPPAPVRSTWRLGHRIPASSGFRVVARSVSAYEESTTVVRGGAKCYISHNPSGTYGPENMVGEKIPVEVAGRPGVRDGAGAEGAYLMWQQPDQSWASSSCYPDEDPRQLLRAAEAVVWKPSSIALPFDLQTLPAGYDVASIDTDLQTGSTGVHIGLPLGPGSAAADLVLSFDPPYGVTGGRPVAVGGRTGTLSEDPQSPRLCLVEQGHQVCVGAESSDTGPYPDRSDQVPTLLAIAGALRFPADLSDRSDWFAAEDVFG